MKITIDQYYLITINRIYKFRKCNIEDIKSIIKKNTNKSVIQTGVDGNNLTPEIISTLQKKKILKYNLEIPNFSRILSNSEIGLNLTEYKIYKHMIKNNIQSWPGAVVGALGGGLGAILVPRAPQDRKREKK